MVKKENIVIYHANCSDGTGAAYAAWERLGDSAVYLPCSYGTDWREFLFDHPKLETWNGDETLSFTEEQAKDCCLFIVDFSFPKQDILDMCDFFGSVTVLDHHDTARQDLKSILGTRKNLLIVFDMERSGAGITWDYFHGSDTRSHMINLIEDRDLWKFKYGDESRAFQMFMKREKPSFTDLRDVKQSIENILGNYMSVLGYHDEMVKEVSEQAVTIKTEFGYWAFVNAPYHMASDLGEVLGNIQPVDVVCIWGHKKNHPDNISMSFRSKGETHVGNLARDYFNGGGHPPAAGGWLPIDKFFYFLENGILPPKTDYIEDYNR